MVISLLAIFILSMAVSAYTIYQLHRLEDITNSIIVGNNLLNIGEKLSNDFLEMRGFEEKYILTKDEEFLDLCTERSNDFTKGLEEIKRVENTPEIRELLKKFKNQHKDYRDIFDKESDLVKSGKDYSENKEFFDQQKDEAEKEILDDLIIQLMEYGRTRKQGKFEKLITTEGRAIQVVLGISVTSLLFIVFISIFITLNITKPLSAIKKKTREIARGEFGNHLELSSPPEIQELEQAFNAMCTRLHELDTLKTDFFSLMSHELRTPLASIKEATNLLIESLRDGEITERQKKLFSIMKEENNRLIKLVNSLLDLSKMEAGMMVYAFNRSDIFSLIKRAVREIEPLAEAKNITVTIDADQGLPFIRVDNERMLQVLRNLIGNAVKFTPKDGKVRVLVKNFEQGIKVSVADTGVGIAKESLMTIFDKFQQEDVLTHSHKIKGTGLGLSLVKHIIKAHGGRIWAESTLGQGSTFTFVLPA